MKPYYEEQGIVIYHGDCREILPTLPKVDFILTDPPYDDYTHAGAFTVSAKLISEDKKKMGISFSSLQKIPEMVSALTSKSNGWTICFCSLEMLGAYQAANPKLYIRGGIWDRIINTPQISGDRPAQGGEGIAIFNSCNGRMKWNGGGKAAIWRHMVEYGRKQHPTAKPLLLFTQLIAQFSNLNQTILDPFMGSGTTLRAAKDLGRKAIGIEIEECHCETAALRLRQEVFAL